MPFIGRAGRQCWPAGHFYSPIPAIDEIKAREDEVFAGPGDRLPGIDLRVPEQLELLDELQPYYDELPFPETKQPEYRYSFDNDSYCYSDAIFLYCMIRHLKPKRLIEIGSGYSSCVALDTNEQYFDNRIACTFIEPYPKLFSSLIKPSDSERLKLMPKKLQDVDLEIFDALEENDILFVDSTHVSKVFSDVNRLLFSILPGLKSGVHIHFHDIFYPFEYPKEWIYKGLSWNEAYILRAFLQYNESFEIELFNTFLEEFHEERFAEKMPLCLKNTGGSIWLKKV